ncbi:DUF2971 domain-containing protein [Flavobacterium notoginsengisoli]|uniref:DUF2971 domain-containing protein n=1 Tax=Flavobacterium notoginsengisoli TaxID=1478199 RepID=UPI00362B269B
MSYFKYTTLGTTKLIIENKSLRWSSPLQFNDIEECQFVPYSKESFEKANREYYDILTRIAKGETLDYDYNKFSSITNMIIGMIQISLQQKTFDSSSIVDKVINLASNPEADFREYINKGLIKIFRILCVTNKYDNKLMWAHYADQHYGCVIELSDLYIERPYNLNEGKVEYHENLHPKTNSLDLLLYGETQELRDLIIKDVIFSKRSAWSYEEEYRLMYAENFGQIKFEHNFQTNQKSLMAINQTDKSYTDVPIDKEFIKSITFGTRVKDDDIFEIKDHLKSNDINCTLYKMILNGVMLERINI